MSASIDLATLGSANPRGRQSISTHRRAAAADTLDGVAPRGRPTPALGLLPMKIALTGTALAIAAAATALAASPPSGTYTTTISGAKKTQLDGRWTVTFSPGHYVVSAAGRQLVTGVDSVSDRVLTMRDTGGPAPPRCTPPDQVGTYTYRSSGSTLTLKVKHDRCTDRTTILASHPLKRA
jgi:hypothetical protein